MIDIILGIIIGVVSLIAALLIPSKANIERNETARYKSGKYFIYAAGCSALFVGVVLTVLYTLYEGDQELLEILVNFSKIGFFVAIGIVLIRENIRKSKLIAAQEGAMTPISAETMGVEAAAQGVGVPQPIIQPQAQQIGIKATTTVQPQPQIPAQQIGVKATQMAQPQPQVQAQQIGVKPTPVVQAQPQVVAPQPRPGAQPPKPRIVVIKCPKCQGNMQINTAMLGQKMKCPHCGVEGRIG